MTFENYKNTRPNLEETSKKLLDIEKRVLDAASAKDVLAVFDEYNTLRRNFWDDYKPELTSLYSKVDKAIYNSKFKDELKKEIGEHYFNLTETTLKVFSDEIIEDLKEEINLLLNILNLLQVRVFHLMVKIVTLVAWRNILNTKIEKLDLKLLKQ